MDSESSRFWEYMEMTLYDFLQIYTSHIVYIDIWDIYYLVDWLFSETIYKEICQARKDRQHYYIDRNTQRNRTRVVTKIDE